MSENTPASNQASKNPDDVAPATEKEQAPAESTPSVADHIKVKPVWLRLFFMLIVALLYSVSRVVFGYIVTRRRIANPVSLIPFKDNA